MQGGVIFAIRDSQVVVIDSLFRNNLASDGSTIFGLANQGAADRMRISRTRFERNWAQQDMINLKLTDMLITDSTIVDNFATYVTHGVVLIKSQMEIASTSIYFTDDLLSRLKNIQKLDTGFFQLQLGSTLTLRSNSIIENVIAQKQSVLSAQSKSNIFISDNVVIQNNKAISTTGSAFLFDNTQSVSI